MAKRSIWQQVLTEGRKNQSNKQVNVLDVNDLETILATMDFFGCSSGDLQQTHFDLKIARYRVFDWLCMGIQGRIQNDVAKKVLVYAFIDSGYNEKKFIDNLRYNDYEINTKWEDLDVSY